MQVITAKTADELWYDALRVCKLGRHVSPRNKTTVEAKGPVILKLEDPYFNMIVNPYRKLNWHFAFAELMSIVTGENTVDRVGHYNKKILEYSDDGKTFTGAYGPPYSLQVERMKEVLIQDRDSRQAVISLWRPNPLPSKDVPCTVMLHFLIRDFKLDLNVYMRSNDVWLGLPYDLFNFTMIQQQLAVELNVGVGTYTHIIGSLHMYAGDVYKAEWALKYAPLHTEVIELNCLMPRIERVSSLLHVADFELILRTQYGGVNNIPWDAINTTPFFRTVRALFEARLKLCAYPEPFRTLIENAKDIHAKIAGSNDEEPTTGYDSADKEE